MDLGRSPQAGRPRCQAATAVVLDGGRREHTFARSLDVVEMKPWQLMINQSALSDLIFGTSHSRRAEAQSQLYIESGNFGTALTRLGGPWLGVWQWNGW